MALPRQPAGARRAAVAGAVRQSEISARHGFGRSRCDGAALLRRANRASGRFGGHGHRHRDGDRDRCGCGILRALDRHGSHARDGGVPDRAQLPPAARAGGDLRLAHRDLGARHRGGLVDRSRAAHPRRVPGAPQPRVRGGMPGHRHAGLAHHLLRDPAQCAAAHHRLCQRRHGAVDTAGERACLSRPVRPQRGLLGQPDCGRQARAACRLVRRRAAGARHPRYGPLRLADRPGAQRRAQSRLLER